MSLIIIIIIIRLDGSIMYVDAAYCYRRSSVVCLSVEIDLSVTIVNLAKMAEPIEMPIG